MMAMAATALVALIAVLALFGGRGYKTTVKRFADAQINVNAKEIFGLLPDGVIDYALEEDGFDSLDEMIDEANERIQNQIDYIERYAGTDWAVSYKITSVEKMQKKIWRS